MGRKITILQYKVDQRAACRAPHRQARPVANLWSFRYCSGPPQVQSLAQISEFGRNWYEFQSNDNDFLNGSVLAEQISVQICRDRGTRVLPSRRITSLDNFHSTVSYFFVLVESMQYILRNQYSHAAGTGVFSCFSQRPSPHSADVNPLPRGGRVLLFPTPLSRSGVDLCSTLRRHSAVRV
eukprot:951696-Rhodomonas_salina.1